MYIMYISSYIHKYVDFISLYMQVGIDMIGPLPLTKKGNRYRAGATSPVGQVSTGPLLQALYRPGSK